MRKIIANLINKFRQISLETTPGQVSIKFSIFKIPMSPALARRLAAELPALASIAERDVKEYL
jgi:hypothetical protein